MKEYLHPRRKRRGTKGNEGSAQALEPKNPEELRFNREGTGEYSGKYTPDIGRPAAVSDNVLKVENGRMNSSTG